MSAIRTNGSLKLVATLVAALALVAGACSSGGDEETGGESTDVSGAIKTGGDMVYALEAETSGGFCFSDSQLAISGMMVTRSIYDLLTVPAEGGGFAPYLLESLESNDTADSWTLKLREDVKFHDGTDLDSTVLKNNIDAWLGRYPARPSLFGVFVLEPIDTVEIVDDLTVEITTKVPWPAFPAYLYGGSRLGIMGQAQLDDPDNCDKNLIGTGPFKLEEWVINDKMVTTRNEDYWATDDDGNQLPYLDSLTFVPVPDSQVRVNGLLAGEYDVIMTAAAPATENLNEEAEAGSVSLYQTTVNAEVNNLMFNHARPPFDDQGAREAAILAMDQETRDEVVTFNLFGQANGPFPPGAPGYLEDSGWPEYDLEKAKELVADYEARTGQPLDFSYLHGNDEESIRSASFNQQQFEAAGMKVNMQTREQATLISEALGTEWDMMAFRNFPAGTPDGNYVWWISDSPVNFPRMNSPEIDALLNEGRSELDEARALEIYEEVNRKLNEGSHFLWTDWVQWTIASQPDIPGILGPTLPDGQQPGLGLSTGHATVGLHYTE